MNKLFPTMYTKPETSQILCLFFLGGWVFVAIPVFMPFLADGFWDNLSVSVWFEIIYHVVNAVLVLLFIFRYLKDEWFALTVEVGHYLKHAALTAGLILGTVLTLLVTLYACGVNVVYLLEALPVSELAVVHTSQSVLYWEPVFGTIVMTVFAPITVCGLYYCLCFAPIGNNKPWLAYLAIPVITLLPALVDILWRWEDMWLTLGAYLVALPVHLLACWSYQKTNNVWTPLLSLAMVNLVFSICLPLVLSYGAWLV